MELLAGGCREVHAKFAIKASEIPHGCHHRAGSIFPSFSGTAQDRNLLEKSVVRGYRGNKSFRPTLETSKSSQLFPKAAGDTRGKLNTRLQIEIDT
jgi:hypothetical protein